MWKPGQIVTVKGIVCRVVKDKFPSCWSCIFGCVEQSNFPCNECLLNIPGKFKLPDDCHLEKICSKKVKP